MQAIFNLESTCHRRSKQFLGTIFLHGPKKKSPQIGKLGQIFETNANVDEQCSPTGKGFEFMVNLGAVYYKLEQDDSLPRLPDGHRAMSIAVIYTLLNNDYLRMATNGLTYARLMATMRSESYKKEVQRFQSHETASPVTMRRRAVFMGEQHDKQSGYNLHGVLLLVKHALMNRTATRKVLLKRYTMDELSSGIRYNIIRAASIIAGETHPGPDPTALLAYISCGNLLFRRWSIILYNPKLRTDDEFGATCYKVEEVKGKKVITIDFNLRELGKSRNALNDESLLRILKQSYYGNLLPSIQAATNNDMPFVPLDEVKKAINNEGFYPMVKVLKADLQREDVETGAEEADQPEDNDRELDREDLDLDDEDGVGSDDDGDSNAEDDDDLEPDEGEDDQNEEILEY